VTGDGAGGGRLRRCARGRPRGRAGAAAAAEKVAYVGTEVLPRQPQALPFCVAVGLGLGLGIGEGAFEAQLEEVERSPHFADAPAWAVWSVVAAAYADGRRRCRSSRSAGLVSWRPFDRRYVLCVRRCGSTRTTSRVRSSGARRRRRTQTARGSSLSRGSSCSSARSRSARSGAASPRPRSVRQTQDKRSPTLPGSTRALTALTLFCTDRASRSVSAVHFQLRALLRPFPMFIRLRLIPLPLTLA
jgi:hypothetical protein